MRVTRGKKRDADCRGAAAEGGASESWGGEYEKARGRDGGTDGLSSPCPLRGGGVTPYEWTGGGRQRNRREEKQSGTRTGEAEGPDRPTRHTKLRKGGKGPVSVAKGEISWVPGEGTGCRHGTAGREPGRLR